ncbi:type VII secretion system-associated protein [Streptomyces sp. BBFR51]|uniref:type VII secretion system-associated protein n=1 Tax=Streptomyces sp. BBFR51 TaxID=3372856 RepID=UPI0037DCA1D4
MVRATREDDALPEKEAEHSKSSGAPVMAPGDAVIPIPPQEIIEAARFARDQWLTETDPWWADGDDVPSWAVVGEWRTDSRGLLVAWRGNDDYRPSPFAMGWDEPTDEVDEALQWVAAGHRPAEAVLRALVEAGEASVLVRGDESLMTALSHDGFDVVPLYTAPEQMAGVGRLTARTWAVRDLVDRLPDGHEFYVNPAGPVAMRVHTEALRAALATDSEGGEETVGESSDV